MRGLEGFHGDFLVDANRLDEIDVHLGGDGANVAKAAGFAHGFVEQDGDDAAVQHAGAPLIAGTKRELANDAAIDIVLLECQQHAAIVVAATTETLVRGIGIETNDVGFAHGSSLRRQSESHTKATRLRSARRTPRWRLRISMRRSSARMVTPRVICFSSSPAKPRRSVFGNGLCT